MISSVLNHNIMNKNSLSKISIFLKYQIKLINKILNK